MSMIPTGTKPRGFFGDGREMITIRVERAKFFGIANLKDSIPSAAIHDADATTGAGEQGVAPMATHAVVKLEKHDDSTTPGIEFSG